MKRTLLLLSFITLLGAGCVTEQKSTSATEMDLSSRGLTEIPMSIFSHTNLKKLNLSNNQLTGAPQSQIGQLKNLVSLDLSNNILTGLPAELGHLNKLEILNVSNNRLTGLPMELGNLSQLRILDISGNPYSSQDLNEIQKKLSKTEIRR